MFQDRAELVTVTSSKALNPVTKRQETKSTSAVVWTGRVAIIPVEARHKGAYSDTAGGAISSPVQYRVTVPAGRPSEVPGQLTSDEAVEQPELRVRDLRTGETLAVVARPTDLASAGRIYLLECGDRRKQGDAVSA